MTQAAILRAIKAALTAGLMVVGVRHDGEVRTAMVGSPAAKAAGEGFQLDEKFDDLADDL